MARSPARFSDAPTLSPRMRATVAAVILAAHVLLAIGLIRAFGGVRALASAVGLAPVVVATIIPEHPSTPAHVSHSHQDEGASGAAGKRAIADQIVASPVQLPIPAFVAPTVAGTGSETRSGASAAGEGTGGASIGNGTGSGGAGNGNGGHYVATRPVKIAGDLTESDYAAAGRARRLGTSVIVALTVGSDGHVTACRVLQASGDPDADAVTCNVALERFRFRPALDQNGSPVEADFGWQQRFFTP